jgi:A/G-specific adenine glycosylase
MSHLFDQQSLIHWFKNEKRDLPWRNSTDPYAVWVSEIMLQQTQVAVVIPYYERWMQRFPTIFALAEASIEEVIKLWEGLGYYSRARNLHEGARFVVEHFKGVFPDNPEDLAKIKGVGAYTVGAILSFAFHQRYPAVDGNVMRVLTRYLLIEDDIAKAKTQKQIRELAAEILPEHESWIFVEALIELGATICQRNPKCSLCPVKKGCQSYIHQAVDRIPFKSNKTVTQNLFRTVSVIESQEKYLVMQVEKGKIMSGLHEFPYFETVVGGLSFVELEKEIQDKLQMNISLKCHFEEVSHSFTRYQVRLYPFHLLTKEPKEVSGYKWLSINELDKIAFSSGHRAIFRQLQQKVNKHPTA